MKVERVSVRRLKTIEPWGNIAVEVSAVLDESDSLEDVFRNLVVEVNTLIEEARLYEKLKDVEETLEKRREWINEKIKELENISSKYFDVSTEIMGLIAEIRTQIDKIEETRQSLLEKIKNFLKG